MAHDALDLYIRRGRGLAVQRPIPQTASSPVDEAMAATMQRLASKDELLLLERDLRSTWMAAKDELAASERGLMGSMQAVERLVASVQTDLQVVGRYVEASRGVLHDAETASAELASQVAAHTAAITTLTTILQTLAANSDLERRVLLRLYDRLHEYAT